MARKPPTPWAALDNRFYLLKNRAKSPEEITSLCQAIKESYFVPSRILRDIDELLSGELTPERVNEILWYSLLPEVALRQLGYNMDFLPARKPETDETKVKAFIDALESDPDNLDLRMRDMDRQKLIEYLQTRIDSPIDTIETIGKETLAFIHDMNFFSAYKLWEIIVPSDAWEKTFLRSQALINAYNHYGMELPRLMELAACIISKDFTRLESFLSAANIELSLVLQQLALQIQDTQTHDESGFPPATAWQSNPVRRFTRAQIKDLVQKAENMVDLRSHNIIGISPIVKDLLSKLADLAQYIKQLDGTQSQKQQPIPPLLIEGETGVGKDVFVKALCNALPERQKKYIDCNCATLLAEHARSELFGHVQGAFTGAVKARAGRFKEANGGILFLNEIGALQGDVQGQLLAVLETGKLEPLGADKSNEAVDVLVVCATNEDLRDPSRFRKDLLARFLCRITIAPLRDRKEDIPFLVQHFLQDLAAQMNKPPLSIQKNFSEDAVAKLFNYDWPANIRELHGIIENLFINPDRYHPDVSIKANDIHFDTQPLFNASNTAPLPFSTFQQDNDFEKLFQDYKSQKKRPATNLQGNINWNELASFAGLEKDTIKKKYYRIKGSKPNP